MPFVCLNASNWIEQSDFYVTVKFEPAGWNFAQHFSSIFIRSNWRVFCHLDRTFTTVKCAQFSSQVRSASAEEVSSLMWRSITLSEHRVQINLHSHWSVQSDAYFMQFSSFCFAFITWTKETRIMAVFLFEFVMTNWTFKAMIAIKCITASCAWRISFFTFKSSLTQCKTIRATCAYWIFVVIIACFASFLASFASISN